MLLRTSLGVNEGNQSISVFWPGGAGQGEDDRWKTGKKPNRQTDRYTQTNRQPNIKEVTGGC